MSDPNKMRNREFHSYASTTALRVLAILTSIAVFIGIVSTISTSKSDSGSAIPVIILALLVAILLPASMHVFLNMSDDLKLTGEVIDDLEEENQAYCIFLADLFLCLVCLLLAAVL